MGNLNKHLSKEKELKKIMRKYKIFEKDIKEDFVKSSGPGGQNINKVSTCVMLQHIPTGVKVKCQEERTQSMNRYKARYLLVKKIKKKIDETEFDLRNKIEKKRRQSRKRLDKLKEKILRDKKLHSEKKAMRKKIDLEKSDIF